MNQPQQYPPAPPRPQQWNTAQMIINILAAGWVLIDILISVATYKQPVAELGVALGAIPPLWEVIADKMILIAIVWAVASGIRLIVSSRKR